ncbi:DUF1932 domain-containing protein [Microbacterium ulmi]|uniref:NAD(P)-dependent oxidoreductase n=1 Tax=Microbacterium ulmi TaxID=179095 RepID=A0A7Y2Q1B3_9MICO|nr:NAD(P)-dependent oxidoreductase [Microbacterium ulmi]NII69190.1 3-hydroxyisobutyrate dehydrogenase-like beta-hydroxyacid dehydrogenase [Microbacterium ulmi]NNH03730.1 NAD(P)-dependent oxidoreductase [Microbacterium ulmi]
MTTIAVLGLGEAGRLYARGLRDAGVDVRGYDPSRPLHDPLVLQVDGLAEAVAGSDVVLSLVGAGPAESVAADALAQVPAASVYADLNTGSPELKHRIAGIAESRGVRMADVAVLAPVPRAGLRTPLLASGPGAEALAATLAPLGVPIDTLQGEPGEAARLKLLRSAFMKGLAALVLEGVGAARALGAESWLRDQIAGELAHGGDALVDRLLEGTVRHAARREQEVRDALAALDATGEPADMARATLVWFERLVAKAGSAR